MERDDSRKYLCQRGQHCTTQNDEIVGEHETRGEDIWTYPFAFAGESITAVENLAARVLKFEDKDIGKETLKAGGGS